LGRFPEYKNKDRRLKTMQDIVKINQNDNVAVALRPLNEGETLDVAGEKVTLVQDIPQGHKFALRAIAQGEEVVKYGFRIGCS
jgi:altronate hydrolase